MSDQTTASCGGVWRMLRTLARIGRECPGQRHVSDPRRSVTGAHPGHQHSRPGIWRDSGGRTDARVRRPLAISSLSVTEEPGSAAKVTPWM